MQSHLTAFYSGDCPGAGGRSPGTAAGALRTNQCFPVAGVLEWVGNSSNQPTNASTLRESASDPLGAWINSSLIESTHMDQTLMHALPAGRDASQGRCDQGRSRSAGCSKRDASHASRPQQRTHTGGSATQAGVCHSPFLHGLSGRASCAHVCIPYAASFVVDEAGVSYVKGLRPCARRCGLRVPCLVDPVR